ncbi:MAG: class I SAM-dependent DNA methyltransferase [Fimbriimonas sp.]
MSSFGPVAPYYDELMKSVPYRMWVGYYLLLLSHQDVHPDSVLDVCCGTGTMCELLHREGYRMAGFDLSPGMIEEARRKAARKKLPIRYEVQDAAEAEMAETYGAAFSFFDSLNNILDPQRLEMAFRRVASHLPTGGSWIFDLNTAYAFEQRMFDQEHLRSNSKLRYKWVGEYDPETRIIEVDMRFWYQGEEFRELHVQRAHHPDEVIAMLERSGFEHIRVFHSYTLNPARHSSDRLHFACLRA